jgi:hypothetical protein
MTSELAVPWVSRSTARALAFSAGMRLGALAAMLGTASAAARRSSHAAPIERLLVLALSAFVATALWGVCAGAYLARVAARRWDATRALVEAHRASVARWCPASARGPSGVLCHGALVLERDGGFAFIDRSRGERRRLRAAPVIGGHGLGWGAALFGAPCEALSFDGQIVYVDRAMIVVEGLRAPSSESRS